MNTIEKKEIKIRTLQVADRKRMSSMIEELADIAGHKSLLNKISSAISTTAEGKSGTDGKNGEESAIKLGIDLLTTLLKTMEEETHEWFSELIGVGKEEFLELPIDTELIIIDQMISSEEASSFFTIASQLYKKILLLRNKFGGASVDTDMKKD